MDLVYFDLNIENELVDLLAWIKWRTGCCTNCDNRVQSTRIRSTITVELAWVIWRADRCQSTRIGVAITDELAWVIWRAGGSYWLHNTAAGTRAGTDIVRIERRTLRASNVVRIIIAGFNV